MINIYQELAFAMHPNRILDAAKLNAHVQARELREHVWFEQRNADGFERERKQKCTYNFPDLLKS